MNRIVIVGGGIAGLSIAHALLQRGVRERGIEVRVLEGASRCGGNIRSETIAGYLCEAGPNGFLDNAPATMALAGAIGLGPSLQPSDDRARRRFVFRHGRLHEVPTGAGGFLATRLLSPRAKLRVTLEPWARPRPEDDETIHAFAARRIGREAADALIDPFVSGVFGGDARQLSLKACFPRMWELETQYGGLFRALLARRRRRRAASGAAVGTPLGRLTSFRGGTEQLVSSLVAALGNVVQINTPVAGIALRADGYTLSFAGGGAVDAASVVLASAASVSAGLVRDLDPPLTHVLTAIPTAPMVVVCLGFDQAQVRGRINGFGFLVPRGEGARILGVLWDSSVYPGRAPAGKALMRAMLGGAHDPDTIALDDAAVLDIVRRDLRVTMGVDAEPDFVHIVRHAVGIPQYTTGHLERLAEADRRLAALPGLFLAGNSYRGVAINACIAEADDIAQRAVATLARRAA